MVVMKHVLIIKGMDEKERNIKYNEAVNLVEDMIGGLKKPIKITIEERKTKLIFKIKSKKQNPEYDVMIIKIKELFEW